MVLLILAVIATVPSVVALVLLKKTLWQARSQLRWTAPLLFAGGAIVLFAIGILSALVLAVFGNDRGLRGTAFGVAHAHYLLWGTALLALLGGLVYWWPKVFGRLLGTRLTAWSAVLLFIGFNCTFFVQFLLGDQGQAARRLDLQRARQHGGLQHDLDDRRVHDRASACCSSCSPSCGRKTAGAPATTPGSPTRFRSGVRMPIHSSPSDDTHNRASTPWLNLRNMTGSRHLSTEIPIPRLLEKDRAPVTSGSDAEQGLCDLSQGGSTPIPSFRSPKSLTTGTTTQHSEGRSSHGDFLCGSAPCAGESWPKETP